MSKELMLTIVFSLQHHKDFPIIYDNLMVTATYLKYQRYYESTEGLEPISKAAQGDMCKMIA